MPVSYPTTEGQPELPEDWNHPEVEELIHGAVDTHVHPFPSPFPRRMGIIEAAEDAARAKYRAIIAKSHHHSMVPDILALNEAGINDIPVKVFGGVALNNQVGGLNPYAVDLALNLGGRIVWFPTLASPAHVAHVNEEQSHGRAGFIIPTITIRADVPISILDESGKVKPEVMDICEQIAAHDVILCGGHLPASEIDKLIPAAQSVGVQRILCSHPQFIVGATPEVCAQWAKKGVYIEHSVGMYGDAFKRGKERWGFDELEAYIKAATPGQTVMVSDTGQKNNDRPVDAIRGVILQLLEHGYSEADIRTMVGGAGGNLLLKESDGV